MSVNSKVPEIRFKGFSGDWNEKILSDQVKLENGFAFQSKYFKKTPTKVIVLTPGSVNIGGGFQADKGQYYDEKKEIPSKYVFEPGEMFITMTDLTPTAQALGFPAIIPKDENVYLHNQRLGKLVGFNGDLAFLYNLLCTTKKQKEVVLTSSGTTVKHTSSDKFLSRFCFFPNKKEQTQIGNYFQKLDSLINQHQQKHNKLSNIKKAMLEKMLPKQGETVPEIRFKGFSGDWGSLILGENAKFIKGQGYSKGDLVENGSPIILYGQLYTKYQTVITSVDTFVTEKDKSVKSIGGEVIIPASGESPEDISRAAVVSKANVILGGDLNVVLPKKNIHSIFLALVISNGRLKKELSSKAQGKSVVHIRNSDLADLAIILPSEYLEQTAIGNYFQKLDALINQHQQQISKLNNIKQACLSKMFV